MTLKRAITLDVDGTIRVEYYGGEDDRESLQSIYALLGENCSNFEQLNVWQLTARERAMEDKNLADLFIDGEGKAEQPINIFATDIMRASGSIHARDWICGKVMFVGPPDDKGNATDVGRDVEKIVRTFVRPQLQHAG